jgi:hypothetical protein
MKPVLSRGWAMILKKELRYFRSIDGQTTVKQRLDRRLHGFCVNAAPATRFQFPHPSGFSRRARAAKISGSVLILIPLLIVIRSNPVKITN